MNATQIIISVIASVTGFFIGLRELAKWAFGRWEASAVENRAAQKETTAALMENTRSNAMLITKVDELSRKIDFVTDFVSESTPVNQPIPRRTPAGGVAVNPGGYSLGRQRTQGDR